ncbi:hypothetical protein [Paenibacillus bouchesdurhonensis]|nr:hypothetical protein [Paenibacillus bouchesdurhonensis]
MEFIGLILLLLISFGVISIDGRLKKKHENDKLLLEKLDQLLEAINKK